MKIGRRTIEKNDEQQKSEHSSYQSHCYSPIAFSKQKRIKLMKGICYNLMMSCFLTSEFESSRLIPKSLRSLLLRKFYLTLMRLKKSIKRMMTILITIKSPSLGNSKLLFEKTIQVIYFIF